MPKKSKKWYRSKTITASIVVVIATLAGFGINISEPEISSLLENIDVLIVTITNIVGAITAIYGRIVADSKIK